MEDKNKYSHPSYGMIRISRVQGHKSCYMSEDIDYGGYILLEVKQSYALRKDYYETDNLSSDLVLRLRLTYNQYSELISTINSSSGVPCTLEYITSNGNGKVEQYKPLPSEIDMFEINIDTEVNNIKQVLSNIEDKLDVITTRANLSKKDIKELSIEISKLNLAITDRLPFIVTMFKEYMGKFISKSKVQIGSWLEHKLYSMGLEKFTNDIKLFDKSKDD